MKTITTFIIENKKILGILTLIILFVVIYPQFFQTVYQSGRDFGRSLVNLMIK